MDKEKPSTAFESAQTDTPAETWSKFPDLTDSVWKWAHDGVTPKGSIQFLNDKTIKWNKGKKPGYWKLKNDMKILETQFLGTVHELKYIAEERKAVVIDSDKNPSGAMWETLTKLSDYEQRGKDIAARYCSSKEERPRPMMSPPAPQQTYKDRYPDNAEHEDSRIKDNIRYQGDYEAEVKVYRSLERLKERLIVLHGFKFTHFQYALCDRNHDKRKCKQCGNSKNSEECDFLIIGEDFFVVIEVKNTTTDGNPTKAIQNSLVQRDRVKELIQALRPDAKVLLYTAFPSLGSDSLERFAINDSEQMNSIIFKEDIDNFAEWWDIKVTKTIRPNFFDRLSNRILKRGRKFLRQDVLRPEHDKVKHILIAISCTEVDLPDESTFSLGKTVMKIDKELREGEITLEQKVKNSKCKKSVNPGVVKASDVITEYIGVKYLTTEQEKVLKSEEKLLCIIGPAGTGKTVLLSGKLIELNKSDPGKKVVVFKFCGENNNSTTYQDICKNAGVEYKVLSTDEYKHTPSQLYEQIIHSEYSVVIVEIRGGFAVAKWFADTFSLLSNYNVLIDDIQCIFTMYYTADFNTLLDTLKLLSKNNTVIIAYDMVQCYYWSFKYNATLEVREIAYSLGKSFNSDQRVTLTMNLRNTCDLSNILSVIRNQFIELESNKSNIANMILPNQYSGHFIRGPITELHVFDKRNDDFICNIVNKELIKLHRNISDNFKIALVYNDSDILELLKDTHGTDSDQITMCHGDSSYSAEWPVVIVLYGMTRYGILYSSEYYLTRLYLAISRARVKCSVYLYPAEGGRLSDYNNISRLIDKLEPFAHVIRY